MKVLHVHDVSVHFGSGEEVENRFSKCLLSWNSDQNDFSYFFFFKLPCYFLLSFESIGLSVQEKKFKIDIQDGSHGGHLGFQVEMILAIFCLQVALILLQSFESIDLHFRSSK